ncbi:MAG: MFS transporter [Bryobacteraceae bacterium]|nr:MFS transporter [Bryobacteraceae bacterium]
MAEESRAESGTGAGSRPALRFVVLLGLVSLFADMTYEGARSIAGPFLATLGATGAAVGLVAGFGEFAGYALRLVAGLITDRTRRYWTLTILGYCINLLAVPALALAGRWEVAALLLMAERVGKALRNPPRDAMLSFATRQIGAGWAFGLHEAMDQIGAILGPLLVAAVLHWRGGYRESFALLLAPALLALAVLAVARAGFPRPQELEPRFSPLVAEGQPRPYWMLVAGAALCAAGFADFPLIAFHAEKARLLSDAAIPVLYAAAMGVDALAALLLGRVFDRLGPAAVTAAPLAALLSAPLAFLGGPGGVWAGMILWGVSMGAQESVLRAAVARLSAPERRGTAYGIFHAVFGTAWFAGSAALGILYDLSIPALALAAAALQAASAVVLLLAGADAKRAA